MSVEVRASDQFERAVKPLVKRYPSLREELLQLKQKLLRDPHQGTHIGHGLYKIRLAIKSKGRGKSGGARVITYVEAIVAAIQDEPEDTLVNLVFIYDKSDMDAIGVKELREMVKAMKG